MTAADPGFWGTPTATVDWCESNYAHLSFVCEFFNSLSSLAMVLVGVVGLLLHRRVLEGRLLGGFALVSVVGLGSIAFHATLRFELQMLDELPMLYLALLMVHLLVENRAERRFGAWFPCLLLGYAVLSTYLSARPRGELQVTLFRVTFTALEFFALARVWLIHRRNRDPRVRRLFHLGMGSYALALVLWRCDIRFCTTLNQTLPSWGIPNPQFHAWWHVLVSCGFYLLLMVIAEDRLRTLGREPQLHLAGGVIPFVRADAPSVQ